MTLRLRYHGWSAVALVGEDGPAVHIDPSYTPFESDPCSGPEDFEDAELILVTHGHFDHCQDVGPIATATGAQVLSSAPLARFLVSRKGVREDRLEAISPGGIWESTGVRVTGHRWIHRTLVDRWPFLLMRRPGGILKMRRALSCLLTSPLLGYRVELPGSIPVTYIGEAFHDRTDRVDLEGVRAGDPGLVIVALEPGLEDEVASRVATMGARSVLAFSGHESLWNFFGLDPVDPGRFLDRLRDRLPGVPAVVARPGEVFAVDGGGDIT